jgi:hypothetical protein
LALSRLALHCAIESTPTHQKSLLGIKLCIDLRRVR